MFGVVRDCRWELGLVKLVRSLRTEMSELVGHLLEHRSRFIRPLGFVHVVIVWKAG